ncbi:MAG: hypothetical protein US76_02845 [Parcubacteria group bacterium GW2011_GWA2_38_13b]|nr:MAG: hypothetical protein US76_02845 [Parcubacteria group bacterium GW2011_GWA2_38_13b]
MKKNKYTIGIDARMYGAAQTGIGTYIEYLVKNLLEIDFEADASHRCGVSKNNFYKIFLMEPEFGRFKITQENVEKIKVNSRWYGWREQLIFPWQMAREKVDLMHFPHFNVPIMYRGKFIVTIHDLTPLYFPGRKMGGSWLRKKAFKFVFKNAARKAEKIIAVSNYTKNDLMKNFSVNEKKIKVIYEGIKKSSNRVSADLESYGITKPYILYVGVWRQHKNLVGLIEAFDILIKKYNMDLRLVLVGGEDPYYPEIRRTWENLNLGGRIVTPGFLKDNEMASFYQNANLFVIPSFAEGFGFVGLEAAAAGTPVVSSNAASLPEILGEGAVYFDPYNIEDMAQKMRVVLLDADLRNKLVMKAHENLKKYSWEKMAKETLGLYEDMLRLMK